MENENKDKNIILTDEQLKEVSGGLDALKMASQCSLKKKMIDCVKIPLCTWKDNRCILK